MKHAMIQGNLYFMLHYPILYDLLLFTSKKQLIHMIHSFQLLFNSVTFQVQRGPSHFTSSLDNWSHSHLCNYPTNLNEIKFNLKLKTSVTKIEH